MPIILRFFPNGEFTQGVDTSASRSRRHPSQRFVNADMLPCGTQISLERKGQHVCVYKSLREVQPGDMFRDANADIFTYLCTESNEHIYAWELTCGDAYIYRTKQPLAQRINSGSWVYIGSSNATILKKTNRAAKGTKGMSKSMARNIRNAAYLLEQKYGKDNLSFLTLTIPNVNKSSLSNICANFNSIVHTFFMWLTKKLKTKNIELEYVYCIEIQSKRLQYRGEYAPHLHILFRGRHGKKSAWCITPKDVRKAWIRILKPYIDCDFDASACENLQRIKRTAAGYISKYMSKGACGLPENIEADSSIKTLVTHWGGMSRVLSRQVKKDTIRLGGLGESREIAWIILRAMDELLRQGLVAFWREGIILVDKSESNTDKRGIKVGFGRLAIPTLQGGLMPVIRYAYSLM